MGCRWAQRPNPEHYSRLRSYQCIASRNLCQFCRQPYAVWLRLGALCREKINLMNLRKLNALLPIHREYHVKAATDGRRSSSGSLAMFAMMAMSGTIGIRARR
jgi:hypothetical protein